MLVKHSRQDDGPLTIDGQFFVALDHIIKDVQSIARRLTCIKFKITEKQLEVLEKGGSVNFNNKNWENLGRAQSYIQDFLHPSYALSFEGGTTIETTEIEQIKLALSSETSEPKSFEGTIGRYNFLHVKINVGGWASKSIRYDIHGQESDVNHLRVLVDKMVNNAESTHTWLYKRWPSLAIAIIMSLILFSSYIYAVSKIDKSIYPNFKEIVISWSVAPLVIFTFICAAFGDKFREMFPKVEFDFGVGGRKRSAKRSFYVCMLGCIVIPVLFLVIPLFLA